MSMRFGTSIVAFGLIIAAISACSTSGGHSTTPVSEPTPNSNPTPTDAQLATIDELIAAARGVRYVTTFHSADNPDSQYARTQFADGVRWDWVRVEGDKVHGTTSFDIGASGRLSCIWFVSDGNSVDIYCDTRASGFEAEDQYFNGLLTRRPQEYYGEKIMQDGTVGTCFGVAFAQIASACLSKEGALTDLEIPRDDGDGTLHLEGVRLFTGPEVERMSQPLIAAPDYSRGVRVEKADITSASLPPVELVLGLQAGRVEP